MAQYNKGRRNVSLLFLLVLGLILGIAIKRVTVGIVIGVALGLLMSGVRSKD